SEPLDNVRTRLENGRVDIVGPRQPELVEQVEIVPEPNAVAIVAPSVVAVVLGGRCARRIGAEPGAKGEVFDVVAKGNRQPGALRLFIFRPLVYRHVLVAAMGVK